MSALWVPSDGALAQDGLAWARVEAAAPGVAMAPVDPESAWADAEAAAITLAEISEDEPVDGTTIAEVDDDDAIDDPDDDEAFEDV